MFIAKFFHGVLLAFLVEKLFYFSFSSEEGRKKGVERTRGERERERVF